MAAHTAMRCFEHECGLIVLKPFPPQFSGYLDPSWEAPPEWLLPQGMTKEKAFAATLKKLERYWSRLGFERIGRTALWGLCPANRRPSLTDALGILSPRLQPAAGVQ